MTENPKISPAKKTIQDPPEYAVTPGEATYQQNGQQAVLPTGTGNQAKETAGTKDWLGGPQNGAAAPKEKKAPKGSLSGGVDEQEGGGPDV